MKKYLVGVAVASFLAAAAHAADPSASISTAGISFAKYTDSGVVGIGDIQEPVLYFIDEKSGPLGDSWYVFFEPASSTKVSATITFDSTITAVYTSRSLLDATNATYGAAGIQYGSAPLMGLENNNDVATFSGNTLTIDWTTNNPGDHIRVFTEPVVTAVPEPSSYALLGLGLVAVAVATWRRQRND